LSNAGKYDNIHTRILTGEGHKNMGRKTRYQIKSKQKNKRRKKRRKLTAQGKNPEEYYRSGFCVAQK